MPGFKLHEPVPIAEVLAVDEGTLVELADGMSRRDIHQDQNDHQYLGSLVGLKGLPLTPTRYTLQRAVSGIVDCWHLDGNGVFFDSPDITMFASSNPPRVLRGEVPVSNNRDWPNFTEDNPVVKSAIKAGTAEEFILMPNVYYLLRNPAIHRSPAKIDPEVVRILGRRIIQK